MAPPALVIAPLGLVAFPDLLLLLDPRRTKVAPEQDAQLTANILAQGLLQPPIVREDGDTVVVIAAERRVRCSIKAKLAEIHVLVRNSDDGGDDPIHRMSETNRPN